MTATLTLVVQQQSVIAVARAQIGKPYMWDGKGPDSFDCSGLTSWAFEHGVGETVGAGTEGQLQNGVLLYADVDWDTFVGHLLPADLVFPTDSHVQLWTGASIIEAPYTGADVRECPQWATPPYQSTVFQIRRYLPYTPPAPPPWPGRYLQYANPWMSGPDVAEWQRGLIAGGFLPKDSDDGAYGPETAAGTVKWAVAKKIPQTPGWLIVGPNNWKAMFG